jgi:hypothetical protein
MMSALATMRTRDDCAASMIVPPSGVRVWLATGVTDMRRYAERTIMRSPRRRALAPPRHLDGFTPHNYLSG